MCSYAAGELEKAGGLFAEAERQQQEQQPEYPLLYSVQGYRYYDLLLSRGRGRRGAQPGDADFRVGANAGLCSRRCAPQFDARQRSTSLLRCRAWRAGFRRAARDDARAAADRARRGDRRPARVWRKMTFIARGLLARAAFRRAVGDWDGAARDLDEAQEIAEPGPMRLYLCDLRARARAARAGAARSLRAAERPRRAEPAAARFARRGRGSAPLGGSAQGARRGAQADRGLRLSSARRGACRARRRCRRQTSLRRAPAARLRSIDPGSVALLLLREAGKVARSAGWGVESRDGSMQVRADGRAIRLGREAAGHTPSGAIARQKTGVFRRPTAHLPQQAGEG